MRLRGPATAALLLLSGGCARPSLLLLPHADGSVGAVAVLDPVDGRELALVVTGNSRTRLAPSDPATRAISAGSVKRSEQALLDQLPRAANEYTIYFFEGSTRMTPQSRPSFEAARHDIAGREGVDVEITGHTDRLGSEEDNDRLSQARAAEILEALVRDEHMDPTLLTAIGRGERQLLRETADGVREPANRRVVIVVR